MEILFGGLLATTLATVIVIGWARGWIFFAVFLTLPVAAWLVAITSILASDKGLSAEPHVIHNMRFGLMAGLMALPIIWAPILIRRRLWSPRLSMSPHGSGTQPPRPTPARAPVLATARSRLGYG
jgi:hypothetical protein